MLDSLRSCQYRGMSLYPTNIDKLWLLSQTVSRFQELSEDLYSISPWEGVYICIDIVLTISQV